MDTAIVNSAPHRNVAAGERIVSVVGGSLLFFNALADKNLSLLKTVTAGYLVFRGTTGYCPLYQAMGKTEANYRTPNINIKTSLSINRPRHAVYAFWRTLNNVPLFAKDVQSVREIDEKTSEWTLRLPRNLGAIRWISEIVKEEPGDFLSWHSVSDSGVENAGKIEFRDAGRFGTEVYVVISYHAPLGVIGEKTATLLNPLLESRVQEGMKNFRRYMETGELPTIDGQPSGRNKVKHSKQLT